MLRVQLHTYTENEGQEVLISDRNDTVLIRVMITECRSHCLQSHTQLDKSIEVNGPMSLPVKLAHNRRIELIRETVAKSGKCSLEFRQVDVPGVVTIEAAEAVSKYTRLG